MIGKTLTLSVPEFFDSCHWTWMLSDANGHLLGEHKVELDGSAPEYDAFVDLDAYLRLHAAPDSREQDERRLIELVGDWITKNVLGSLAAAILKFRLPVAVRVRLPPAASWLMYRPLEIATVGGKPLANQDVTFVFEFEPESDPVDVAEISSALRILAVFSMPTGTTPLSVRHERVLLQKLFNDLATRKAVEFRILQYGVTEESLRNTLKEKGGWDLIHISGHGRAGTLLLEGKNGGSVPLKEGQLLKLLALARTRLKLVTLSSCLSAAQTLSQARIWVGLPGIREDARLEAAENAASCPDKRLPGLASTIIQNMDCAVLAMRYTVEDRFAIEFSRRVYDYTIALNNVLPRALQLALSETAVTSDIRPIAVATPVLFGRRGVSLTLAVPDTPGKTLLRPPFLPQPSALFVGRSSVMSQASMTLAGSDHSGVILFGMAGIGKSSCVVELADLHWASGRFSGFLWHKVPDQGKDVDGPLLKFADDWDLQILERQNSEPAFPLNGRITGSILREKALSQLASNLAAHAWLIVVDNLESLLTPDGTCRNEGFQKLLITLLSHGGASRTIITSRLRPVLPDMNPLNGKPVRACAYSINALPRDEALLLARQMPNLGKLFQREQDRELAERVFKVTQGHPKLLELADKQAADRRALRTHLEQALERLSGAGKNLDSFLMTGEAALSERDFLATLQEWTRTLVTALPEKAQYLFKILCCLEEKDRRPSLIDNIWPTICHCLKIGWVEEDTQQLSARLQHVGLIEIRATTDRSSEAQVSTSNDIYYIHPGISETSIEDTPEEIRVSLAEIVADYWYSRYQKALDTDAQGGSADVVQAGLRVAPYLLRLKAWDKAADVLEEVRYRDDSVALNERLVPDLEKVLKATEGTERNPRNRRILGSVLLNAGEFERAREYLDRAARECEAVQNFKEASVALDVMLGVLRRTGHFQEAFATVEKMKDCTKRAGLGPWSQFVDEIWGLSLLHDTGQDDKVLEQFKDLEKRMDKTPETLGSDKDPAEPWSTRDFLLDVARQAALTLGKWDLAISLNKKAIEIQENRAASKLTLAQARFNDYFPLLKTRNYDKARDLIIECRKTFEQEESHSDIGECFAALAALERDLDHLTLAIDHGSTALRYRYKDRDPEKCARGHFHLAGYLALAQREPAGIGAHRLAGGLILSLTWAGQPEALVRLIKSMPETSVTAAAPLPDRFDLLCNLVQKIQGVSFQVLLSDLLNRRGQSADQAITNATQVLAGRALNQTP